MAAVAHALSVIEGPIHIVSDCKGVVEGVRATVLGDPLPLTDDIDIWEKIRLAVGGRGDDQVEITWIKSHVNAQDARGLEAFGGFERLDLESNDQADLLAKKGAAMHDVAVRNYRAADDREILANLVQRMLVTVWSSFFGLVEDEWEQTEEALPGPGNAISELDGDLTKDLEDYHGHDDVNDDMNIQINPMDQQERISVDWTSEKIAQALRERPTGYCWELQREECGDRISFVVPRTAYDHTPGASAQIPGRGKVNTGIDASPILIEAIRWWIASLRWTPHWRQCPQEKASHCYTVTYCELVVDLEASTGIQVPGADWAEKSNRLAAVLRAIARVYGLESNGRAVTWKFFSTPR